MHKLPIISFYKNKIISSRDYTLFQKDSDQTTALFLQKMNLNYFSELKIVQIDFEAFHNSLKSQNALYLSPIAQVYVVHSFEFISPLEMVRPSSDINLVFKNRISKIKFIDAVKKIISDINRGRFYQVNLTTSFTAKLHQSMSSLDLFLNFYKDFQPSYPSFLPSQNFDILSFSPELFLKKENSKIISRPIKGTVKNEKNFMSDLFENKKEDAELSMIVDLLRNDMNSITTGPVVVAKHREKLKLPYVTHTYSEITGNTEKQLPEILGKMMPGGSISGCPKLESLLAISELEPDLRQFYTGSIGWWQQNDFELSIAIRSFVRSHEKLCYFAGCGIVADSDPEKEWLELLSKAAKLNLDPSE